MAETQDLEQFAPLKKMVGANGDFLAAEQDNGDNNLGGLMESFLKYVEKNGIPEGFTWEDVKAIIIAKFNEVTKKYEVEQPIASLPPVPNVDNYTVEEYSGRILEHLNRFEDSPFTIARICELLQEPRKHYDRGDKFLRAFEKCVTVTSTNGTADSTTNGTHINGNGNNEHSVETTHSNGTDQMETDAAETINGEHHTNGSANGVTEAEAIDESAPVVASTTVDSISEGEKVEESSAPAVVESAESTTDSTAVTNGNENGVVEEEKQTQKRSNEDDEHDSVAKKIARIENNGLNGSTHAVVGEPEVEPHHDGESKKAVDVDSTTVDEIDVGVGQEAAV